MKDEIKRLRESTGMNRKEFCEYFEIPYMTETDWELGKRRVPPYLLRLIAYKIQMEKLATKIDCAHTNDTADYDKE
ncbi:MAG: transcriptional regulator [Lachnospiraceae bacterium]|nr:transcriptional regulator [Lachnospiraceae bacterium]